MSDDSKYAARIARIHEALGISPDYARQRQLPLQLEVDAADLVVVATTFGKNTVALAAAAATAWRELQSAAARDRIFLEPLSGFRSVPRQEEIIRRKLAAGVDLSSILKYVAAPGYSEHHTGRALDVGIRENPELEETFAATDAFRWLSQYARQFGFRLSYPRDNPFGFGFEPWHWCWQQTAVPQPIRRRGGSRA